MSPKTIKILCQVLEAIFATIGAGAVLEQSHPYLALIFLALARGTAALKDELVKESSPATKKHAND